MDNTAVERLVEEYVNQLDRALDGLPAERRTQLLAEVRQHISDACAAEPELSESSLRTILDHVGPPEDIAASAFAESPPPARRLSRRSRIAIALGSVAMTLVVVLIVVVTPATSPQPNGTGTGIGKQLQPVTPTLTRVVPNVVGLKASQATATMSAASFRARLAAAVSSNGAQPGTVVAQTPPAGIRMPAGSSVSVSVAEARSPDGNASTTTTVVVP